MSCSRASADNIGGWLPDRNRSWAEVSMAELLQAAECTVLRYSFLNRSIEFQSTGNRLSTCMMASIVALLFSRQDCADTRC